MIEWIKEKTEFVCKAIWCHRAAYAGLALAYGAGCAGWIDKEVVSQLAAALYAAMVAQKH